MAEKLDPMGTQSLGEAERQAQEYLNIELDDHLKLTQAAFNLISNAVSEIPEQAVRSMPQSLKVSVALINKLSNDLRTASLLALLGYPIQAAEVVASLYEAAFTIAHIGADERLAQEWINHDDPTKPFTNTRTMTRSGLAKLAVTDLGKQTSKQYLAYRQLCMAKHANPLVQMQHGFQLVSGDVLAFNGPDTSEPAVRAAWFALEQSASLAFFALASFISNHVPPERQPELFDKLEDIARVRKELNERAIARWGPEDPFPGRWRV